MDGTWLVVQLRTQMSIIIRQIIHQISSRNDLLCNYCFMAQIEGVQECI